MAKKITFLKGNLCILKFFIDVLYIFLFSAKEKLQFEMDFVLNLPCAKPIVYLGVGSTIQIVLCELVLRINFLDFEEKFSRNGFSVYCFEFVHP